MDGDKGTEGDFDEAKMMEALKMAKEAEELFNGETKKEEPPKEKVQE